MASAALHRPRCPPHPHPVPVPVPGRRRFSRPWSGPSRRTGGPGLVWAEPARRSLCSHEHAEWRAWAYSGHSGRGTARTQLPALQPPRSS